MALGDSYSNNNNGGGNKVYDRTYYCPSRIKNKEGLAIEFQYVKGLLIVIISKEAENYRFEPVEQIAVSPTKARKFLSDIDTFIDQVKKNTLSSNHAFGFNSGVKETVSFLALKLTGKDTEMIEHEIVIGKINSKGEIVSQTEFVFNKDYNYSLEWTDFSSMKVDKVYDQFADLRTLRDVFYQFTNSYSGAIGASVWYSGKYDMKNLITKRFDAIYEKLGIDTSNGGGTNYFDSNNSMNPPQQPHSNTKTYEEIEDMID